MKSRRVLTYVAIGAGVVVVLGVAVAAFASLKVPFTAPNAQVSSGPCTPLPCADVRGFTLWVGDLKIADGLVTMELTFRNSSAATHADPADLSLTDSRHTGNAAIYDTPGCTHWPRTDFKNGAFFGPVPECFRPFSTAPPLSLHWTPDMGPFCCDIQIPLE